MQPHFVEDAFQTLLAGANAAISSQHIPIEDHEPVPLQLATTLSNALGILHDQIHSYIHTLYQEYNAHLPVHQLPVEIFADIVHRSLEGQRPRIRALSKYTTVCRWWRDAIDSTPSLWSTVTPRDTPNYISKAIMQSRTSPLDACLPRCTTTWRGRFGPRDVPHPSIPELFREVSRWKAIDLGIHRDSVVYLEQLGLTVAPKLEILKLVVDPGPYQLPTIDLFAGSAEYLRCLHLRGLQIPWTSRLLLQVQDLELGDAWISGPQLGAVIQSNPHLRRLIVAGVAAHNTPAHSTWPPESSIQHNNLREIRLGSKPSSPAAHLLPHLLIPSYEVLSVSLGPQHDSGVLSSTTNATLTHFVSHTSSISTKAINLLWLIQPSELNAFDCHATFSQTSCDLRLNIPMPYMRGSTWAQEVVKIVARAGQKLEHEVTFEWNHGRRRAQLDEGLVTFFGHLPGVRILVCRSGLAPCLVDMMSRPLEGINGPEWLFPEVEGFIYHDNCLKREALDTVLLVMKSRYGRSSCEVAANPETPPYLHPLRDLQIPGWAEHRGHDTAIEIFNAAGLTPKFHDQ